MNEEFYLLPAGGFMISSGMFLWAQLCCSNRPPRRFLTVDEVRCLNVHVHPEPRGDALTSQAAYNEHSVITVTCESRSAGSTHAARPHASAGTQITLFYYLPVRIIYGVITELHNESGCLFKF